MGFGKQVGKENRAKSETKSFKTRVGKMMKKDAFWKPPGGGNPCTRYGGAGILGPPHYQFSKKTPHHSPQTKEHLVTPCAQARWRIINVKNLLWNKKKQLCNTKKILRNTKKLLWNTEKLFWNTKEILWPGSFWNNKKLYGIPRGLYGTPRNFLWNTKKLVGIPRSCIEY